MIGNNVEVRVVEGFSIESNTYLISVGQDIAVIDPGMDPERLFSEIAGMRKRPVWVAATHGHIDHMDDAKVVSEELGVPFYLHPDERLLIEGKAPTQLPDSPVRDQFDDIFEMDEGERPQCSDIRGGDLLKVGEVEVEVIETPGHSFGSVSFYIERANLLFCGDAYANAGKYTDEKVYTESIEKLKRLPQATIIYPGHGPVMTWQDFHNEAAKVRD